MKSIKLISILVIVLFFGCKKYPEDDKRYFFKGPMYRVTNFNWKVEKLLIDNKDSTKRTYINGYSNRVFDFSSVGITFSNGKYPDDFIGIAGLRTMNIEPLFSAQTTGWDFENKKNQIKIHTTSNSSKYNTFKFNTYPQYFNILKLTETDFIIESIEEQRKIKIILKAN